MNPLRQRVDSEWAVGAKRRLVKKVLGGFEPKASACRRVSSHEPAHSRSPGTDQPRPSASRPWLLTRKQSKTKLKPTPNKQPLLCHDIAMIYCGRFKVSYDSLGYPSTSVAETLLETSFCRSRSLQHPVEVRQDDGKGHRSGKTAHRYLG